MSKVGLLHTSPAYFVHKLLLVKLCSVPPLSFACTQSLLHGCASVWFHMLKQTPALIYLTACSLVARAAKQQEGEATHRRHPCHVSAELATAGSHDHTCHTAYSHCSSRCPAAGRQSLCGTRFSKNHAPWLKYLCQSHPISSSLRQGDIPHPK